MIQLGDPGNDFIREIKLSLDKYDRNTLDRLLSSIKFNTNGCWLFTGSLAGSRYGQIHYKGKLEKTHRLIMALIHRFDVTDIKIHILHKHDICPSKRCFNPDHLKIGDHSENMQDNVKMGIHNMASKTHCKHGHEFTKENTYIRVRGGRRCRICDRLAGKKYRDSLKGIVT